jgi:enoyl reductase
LVLGQGLPAYADDTRGDGSTAGGTGQPNADSGADSGANSGKGSIGAHIRINQNTPASSGSTATATSSDANWEPPVCWYEPMYTPEEYEKFIKGAYGGAAGGSPAADYAKKREKEKYHKGDEGLWWQVQFPDDTYDKACPVTTDNWEIWVPPADPQPDPNKVTPEILSELAFNSTKLPTPPVELQPRADRLLVNLGTRVAFKGDLDRVWTTASLDYKGVQLAATTVATPVALKVDAGTADADPQSCTYDLVKGKDGYKADSEDSGCNVTYLRSSGTGTYPFKASITWKVTWTDSADPDGPPQQPGLPDGLSTFEQDVTVKEAQAVNRASGG